MADRYGYRSGLGRVISFATQLLLWVTIAATIVAAGLTLCSNPAQCQQRTSTAIPVPDPVGTAVACPPRGLTIDGEVIRVLDGDTIEITSCVIYRVRLLDCWAPESRTTNLAEKAAGLRAKDRMTEIAHGRQVRVHVPTDSSELVDIITLGRVLGHVWPLDPQGQPERVTLNARMIADGLAWPTKDQMPEFVK